MCCCWCSCVQTYCCSVFRPLDLKMQNAVEVPSGKSVIEVPAYWNEQIRWQAVGFHLDTKGSCLWAPLQKQSKTTSVVLPRIVITIQNTASGFLVLPFLVVVLQQISDWNELVTTYRAFLPRVTFPTWYIIFCDTNKGNSQMKKWSFSLEANRAYVCD